MEIINVEIAPQVYFDFIETKPGRYSATHPIRADEFRLLRNYAISKEEYIHWGDDSFEFLEVKGDLLPIMSFGTANTILQIINTFFLECGNNGKCRLPKTGEILDENYSHWLESDAEEISRLSKAPLYIVNDEAKQAIRGISDDLKNGIRENKQLLWLVYELPVKNSKEGVL